MFLSFLVFILILVGVFAFMIIATVFGFILSIFGFGKRSNRQQNSENQTYESSGKEKIFKKTEGEYVDFEEIN